MSCEKQGGPYNRLSLVDGTVEQVHFRPAEDILRENKKLSIKPALDKVGQKTVVAEDLLGR